MTPPIQPEVDPHDYLVWLYANGTPEQVAEWEQHLWNTGQNKVIDIARNNFQRHDEYNRGLLGGRMARTNQNEREAEVANRPNYPAQVAGGISGLIADVPGGEAVQAGARSLVRDQSYPDALSDIRSARESNPASLITRIAGSLPAAMALSGGALAQGAQYGGLLNLLSADPDENVGERLARGAGGALIGGAASKAGDVAGTWLRARVNPGYERLAKGLDDRMDEAVSPLYEQADLEAMLAQGARGTRGVGTPGIRRALNEPDIAATQSGLRGEEMRAFRDLPRDDPRMLDATYKALVDQANDLANPEMRAATASNVGRYGLQNAQEAKRQLLNAMSREPGAPMPTYASAVEETAAQGGLREALDRGAEGAYLAAGSGNAPGTLQRLSERGPVSLLDFLETQGDEGIDLAVQGAEAAMKRPLGGGPALEVFNPIRTMGRASIWGGGDLLRKMQPTVATTSTLGGPKGARGLLELLRLGGATASVPEFGRP